MPALFVLIASVFLSPPALDAQRSSGRWEATIAEFEAADRINPPKPGVIVFIGSSSIRGWTTLEEDFSGLDVVNRGFGGSEMFNAADFAGRIVTPYRPSRIVLYEGDNDTNNGTPPDTIVADLKRFVAAVRDELPDTPIYVLAVKPSPRRWKIWLVVKETNELFKALCDSDQGLVYVDVATPMLRESDLYPRPELFQADSLHLERAGYELWKSVLRPYLEDKPGN